MSTKKSTATKINPNNPESPVQVLKEDTCPTSSGKSTLGYQVCADESGAIHLKVSSNDGGGMFSPEWIAFTGIQSALTEWPDDQGVTSMTFRKIFRGKSANTPGFLIAVLVAEGLIEPVPGKTRVHQPCDPATFLASLDKLKADTGVSAKKPARKPRTQAAPKAKAKVKSATRATAKTAKTPRKSPASSRKTK